MNTSLTPAAGPRRARGWLLLLLATIGAIAGAVRLFPSALPTIALRQSVTRADVVERASAFVREHALHDADARTAVNFASNDSVRIFLDLAGGGKQALDSVVRGSDYALFTWAVRFFEFGDAHEATVYLAPDGRVAGFSRKLADADRRPAITADSALVLAHATMRDWLQLDPAQWRLQASNYEVVAQSARVDHQLTFERTDVTVGGAPLRLNVVIAGDTPSAVREQVVIPESFSRRYGEMRSWNDFLALLSTIGVILWAVLVMRALVTYGRDGLLRWRPAMTVGFSIGVLLVAASLNQMPNAWYSFDTASSPAFFRMMAVVSAVLGGGLMGLVVGVTLAAAEALTRHAFPGRVDWWQLWRWRGTREVTGQVFGGYALAAIVFLYLAVFYVTSRRLFGWWVPSGVFDDPNLIATPLPWVAGFAISAQAAVWEEALFRAVPLATLALWVRGRRHARLLMAAGVVLTALVFGFAHANYPSWPPYSRGVELFFDAVLWALVFLRFGLLVTVLAHFLYDLVLFGLFASAGTALPYRVTLLITALIALAPAAAVAWRWLRQRRLETAPTEALFGAWRPGVPPALVAGVRIGRALLSPLGRRLALVVIIIGVTALLLTPHREQLGPGFSATRIEVLQRADSALASRDVPTEGWTRLARTRSGSLGEVARFLREHERTDLADSLVGTWLRVAGWDVRYVHVDGTIADRAEEWRVYLLPDGRVHSVEHVLSTEAPGDSLTPARARVGARAALAAAGIEPDALREASLDQTTRDSRIDTAIEYVDPRVVLPGGASARVRVSLAGSDVSAVRRFLQLPESFLREDRRRADDTTLWSVLSILLGFAMVVGGIVYIVRRRAPLIDGVEYSRMQRIGAVLAIAVLTGTMTWNGWAAGLFNYNTATPWSTFLVSGALIGVVSTLFLAMFVTGVVHLSSAIRHRLGIPFWPVDGAAGGARDAVIGGLALALLPVAVGLGATDVATDAIPAIPASTLDQASPLLGAVVSVLFNAIMMPAFLSMPFLVAAAFIRRPAFRVALLLTAAFVVATTAGRFSLDVVDNPWVIGVGAAITIWIVYRAFDAWGTQSAASWIVAALAWSASNAVPDALNAATSTERVAAVGAGLAAMAGIAGFYVLMRRRPGPPRVPAVHSAEAGDVLPAE
jgi:hypothetical protein